MSYQKLQSAQACPSCRQQIWGAMSWSHSSTPVPGVRIAPGAPELGVLCCSSSYAGSELQRCSDGPKRAAPARAGTGGSSRKSTFPAWCRQQLPGTERCAKTCAFLLWCFLSEVHGGVLVGGGHGAVGGGHQHLALQQVHDGGDVRAQPGFQPGTPCGSAVRTRGERDPPSPPLGRPPRTPSTRPCTHRSGDGEDSGWGEG